ELAMPHLHPPLPARCACARGACSASVAAMMMTWGSGGHAPRVLMLCVVLSVLGACGSSGGGGDAAADSGGGDGQPPPMFMASSCPGADMAPLRQGDGGLQCVAVGATMRPAMAMWPDVSASMAPI